MISQAAEVINRTLSKVGGGPLFLTAVNTYRGGTAVSAGSLFVDGVVPNRVSLGAGARLGGNGTVAAITSRVSKRATPATQKENTCGNVPGSFAASKG